MNPIMLILALAALAAGCSHKNETLKNETLSNIPPELEKVSNQAFAEGKTYFIWRTNTQSLKGESSDFMGVASSDLFVEFQATAYSVKNTPAFRTVIDLESIDRKENKLQSWRFILPDEKNPGNTFKGPVANENGMVVIGNGILKGPGNIRIHLIPADVENLGTNDISNTLEVQAEFKFRISQ